MLNFSRRFLAAPISSERAKKMVTEQTTRKHQPIMLVSEYGELLNVRPMTKLEPSRGQGHDLREVIMIDDNTDVKTITKKMNHSPKAFFLFSPKGHWQNAQALYASFKRQLIK